jgi:hypothetical protein
MILPRPDLLWDELDISPSLDEFQQKIAERVRYEKDKQVYAILRLSFAHIRRNVFAPRIIKLLDDGYSRS